MRIHQIGSALSYGDAVTNDIAEIHRCLTAWGFDARIYGANIGSAVGLGARPDTAYTPFLEQPGDLLVFHYSAYCDNIDLYLRSRNRKLLIYHNITPAEYFAGYSHHLESVCRHGRLALPCLAGCDLALGDSEYNRQELVTAGFPAERTGVLPLLLPLDELAATQRDEPYYRRLRVGGVCNILFVGRIAPNKAIEDLIKIFYAYHRYIRPDSRLILAGLRALPVYDAALQRLVARLGLGDAVVFTGRISLPQLVACYQAADLFLCASRHEGFCAPLVEAMQFGLPILARAEAAVPETLGGRGVTFSHVSYPAIAEMIDLLISDQGLRARVVEGQREHLTEFALERVAGQLRAVLERLATP